MHVLLLWLVFFACCDSCSCLCLASVTLMCYSSRHSRMFFLAPSVLCTRGIRSYEQFVAEVPAGCWVLECPHNIETSADVEPDIVEHSNRDITIYCMRPDLDHCGDPEVMQALMCTDECGGHLKHHENSLNQVNSLSCLCSAGAHVPLIHPDSDDSFANSRPTVSNATRLLPEYILPLLCSRHYATFVTAATILPLYILLPLYCHSGLQVVFILFRLKQLII
jgi:hypothetical protein